MDLTGRVLASLSIIINWESVISDHDPDKLKEFEKLMGEPNIYYENGNLVLRVTVHKGPSNRIVDSGIESVGVQLKDCDYSSADKELVHFMSKLLKIDEKLFKVNQGKEIFKKIIEIREPQIQPYEVIDKLVDALEITAKKEPSALQVNHKKTIRQPNGKQTKSESKEDPIRVFDWRDGFQN